MITVITGLLRRHDAIVLQAKPENISEYFVERVAKHDKVSSNQFPPRGACFMVFIFKWFYNLYYNMIDFIIPREICLGLLDVAFSIKI